MDDQRQDREDAVEMGFYTLSDALQEEALRCGANLARLAMEGRFVDAQEALTRIAFLKGTKDAVDQLWRDYQTPASAQANALLPFLPTAPTPTPPSMPADLSPIQEELELVPDPVPAMVMGEEEAETAEEEETVPPMEAEPVQSGPVGLASVLPVPSAQREEAAQPDGFKSGKYKARMTKYLTERDERLRENVRSGNMPDLDTRPRHRIEAFAIPVLHLLMRHGPMSATSIIRQMGQDFPDFARYFAQDENLRNNLRVSLVKRGFIGGGSKTWAITAEGKHWLGYHD